MHDFLGVAKTGGNTHSTPGLNFLHFSLIIPANPPSVTSSGFSRTIKKLAGFPAVVLEEERLASSRSRSPSNERKEKELEGGAWSRG